MYFIGLSKKQIAKLETESDERKVGEWELEGSKPGGGGASGSGAKKKTVPKKTLAKKKPAAKEKVNHKQSLR